MPCMLNDRLARTMSKSTDRTGKPHKPDLFAFLTESSARGRKGRKTQRSRMNKIQRDQVGRPGQLLVRGAEDKSEYIPWYRSLAPNTRGLTDRISGYTCNVRCLGACSPRCPKAPWIKIRVFKNWTSLSRIMPGNELSTLK